MFQKHKWYGALLVPLFFGYIYYLYITDVAQQTKLLNTPVTAISNLAEGFVRIKGIALPGPEAVRCPISNTGCIYYYWSLEEFTRSRSRSGRIDWFGINSDRPFIKSFKIKDGTGEIFVLFPRARDPGLFNLRRVVFNGSDMPDYVKNLVKAKLNVDDSYFEKHQKLRITELSINIGDTISVYGNAVNEKDSFIIDGSKSDNFIFLKENNL